MTVHYAVKTCKEQELITYIRCHDNGATRKPLDGAMFVSSVRWSQQALLSLVAACYLLAVLGPGLSGCKKNKFMNYMKKIKLGQKEKIHFIGIGGIGMSGLAQIMKNMGFKIQGSDQVKNKNTTSCSKAGIKVFIGHSRKNVKNKKQ